MDTSSLDAQPSILRRKVASDLETLLDGLNPNVSVPISPWQKIGVYVPSESYRAARKRLREAGFPILKIDNFGGSVSFDLNFPNRYFFSQKSEEELSGLSRKIKEGVDSLASKIDSILPELKAEESRLNSYPSKMLEYFKGKKMPMKEKKPKLEALDSLIEQIKNMDQDNKNLHAFLSNKSFENYQIDIISTKDSYTKVSALAWITRICWDSNRKLLSKVTYSDFKKYGGTIIYAVYPKQENRSEKGFFSKLFHKLWDENDSCDEDKENSPPPESVVFCRSFIIFDKKGKKHLFVDIMEGAFGATNYIHYLDDWVNSGDIGALKLGVLFNIKLGKTLGVDYITAGDSGLESIFKAFGASEVKLAFDTEEGQRFDKLGYMASDSEYECFENVVKCHFLTSEKYYSLQLDKLL